MKNKIIILIVAAVIISSIFVIAGGADDVLEHERYASAVEFFNEGRYGAAFYLLQKIQGYSTSQSYYDECERLLEEITISDENILPAIIPALYNSGIIDEMPAAGSQDGSYSEIQLSGYQIDQVKSLDLSGNKLADLSFISIFVNLEELILDDNDITDLTPLKDLYKLQKLSIANNEIEDITPLYNLTNLTSLNLSNNNIKEIDNLANLLNMTELDISNNQIEGIWVVKGFPNLVKLNASGNRICYIRALSGLKNLKELYLMDNEFKSVAALSTIESLEVLEIGAYWFSYEDHEEGIEEEMAKYDVSIDFQFQNREIYIDGAFDNLTNLRKLKMVSVGISSFEFLQSCPNIQELSLVNSVVYAQDDTLYNVAYLNNLTYLELHDNRMQAYPGNMSSGIPMRSNEVISQISELVSLKHLDIGVNCFSDLSPLGNLTNLEYLDISYTHSDLKDISFLSNLKKLTHLNIARTPSVIDYSPLKDLNNLEYLDLTQGNLKYFEYIAHMDKLKHLNLLAATYNSIDGIENMKDLEYLNLNTWYGSLDEKISDLGISPFESKEEREEYEASYHITAENFKGLRNITEYYGPYYEEIFVDCNDEIAKYTGFYASNNKELGDGIGNLWRFESLEKLSFGMYVTEDCEIVIPYMENLWYLNIELEFAYMNNPEIEYKPTVTIDLSAFEGQTKLEYISIGQRNGAFDYRDKQLNIPSLKGLENCTNLRVIIINDANLSDISALANCEKLEIVDFSNCDIEDISALENKHYIKQLNLMKNKITDISVLENCYRMERLRLSDNRITNRQIVREMPILGDVWID